MKGNVKVIARLNSLLTDELGAICQYTVHAEMCSNWGFKKMHDAVEMRATDGKRHVEKIINRILFLEGVPAIGQHLNVSVGNDVEGQLKNDLEHVAEAILVYHQSMVMAEAEGDPGTADILDSILIEEERHLDWLIEQINLIKKQGVDHYAVQQLV